MFNLPSIVCQKYILRFDPLLNVSVFIKMIVYLYDVKKVLLKLNTNLLTI